MAQYFNKTQLMTNRSKGFTLIEIMITIAILGIIAAVAWPSYERYQEKGRRADGISALLQNSANLEKCFLNNNGTYVGCAITSPSPRQYYSIAANPALAAESYTLVATPQNAQAGDVECATLTINQLGVKDFTTTADTGAGEVAGTLRRCWSQ